MVDLERKLTFYRGSIYHYSKLALSHSMGTVDFYKLRYYQIYREIDIALATFDISSYRNQMLRDWVYNNYFKHPDKDLIGNKKMNRVFYYVIKHLLFSYGPEIAKTKINKIQDEKLKRKCLRILDLQQQHFLKDQIK